MWSTYYNHKQFNWMEVPWSDSPVLSLVISIASLPELNSFHTQWITWLCSKGLIETERRLQWVQSPLFKWKNTFNETKWISLQMGLFSKTTWKWTLVVLHPNQHWLTLFTRLERQFDDFEVMDPFIPNYAEQMTDPGNHIGWSIFGFSMSSIISFRAAVERMVSVVLLLWRYFGFPPRLDTSYPEEQ